MHFFHLNEHAITGSAMIESYSRQQSDQSSGLFTPSSVYSHVAHASCPQGHLTLVGTLYCISNTLPVAATTDAVISLARRATPATLLILSADLSFF